jgi:predicted nucleic acid-binding protein
VIALIDTSVVLRKLFGEPRALLEWQRIRETFASRILLVELGRMIDRSRLTSAIDDAQVEQLQSEARRLLRSVALVGLTDRILTRAAGPMATVLGTLDAIHLATAQDVAISRPGLLLATHDKQLARAARASGLDVCGA